MKRSLLGSLSLVVVTGLAGWSFAQDDESELNFGKGVHAYFSGDLEHAKTFLDQAIGDGSVDPRAYYFRGLTHGGLGDLATAQQDFQTGAQVELSPRGRSFDVGESLERVQGPMRIQLEKIRQEAIAVAQSRTQRRPVVAPPAKTAPAGAAAVPAGDESTAGGGGLDPRNLPDVSSVIDPTVPFPSTEAVPHETPEAAEEMPSEEPAAEEPAAEPAADQDKPPADDPFGGGGGDDGGL
jgi:hypothetical protein